MSTDSRIAEPLSKRRTGLPSVPPCCCGSSLRWPWRSSLVTPLHTVFQPAAAEHWWAGLPLYGNTRTWAPFATACFRDCDDVARLAGAGLGRAAALLNVGAYAGPSAGWLRRCPESGRLCGRPSCWPWQCRWPCGDCGTSEQRAGGRLPAAGDGRTRQRWWLPPGCSQRRYT